MAEYIDITETGPLTGQQLKQQNTNNSGNFSRTYTPGVGPITGPIITPEQQQLVDKENKENSRVRYVVPKGTQLNNNYEISTEAERKKWWESEGRKKYGSRFGDASIKKGYFNDKELEGVYRDMLFNKEFSNLPEYKDLLKLSPDERDSFYAYWRGRVNALSPYSYIDSDNFAQNPEGREAGRVLADLNYYFGENFDDWSTEERKKFYNEWNVKKYGNDKFNQAEQNNPEIKRRDFKTQQDIDNYLKTAFNTFDSPQTAYQEHSNTVTLLDNVTNFSDSKDSIETPQSALENERQKALNEAIKKRDAARRKADQKLRDDLSGKNGFWVALASSLQRAGDPLTSGSPSIIADDANRLEAVGLEEEASTLRSISLGIGLTGAAMPMIGSGAIGGMLGVSGALSGLGMATSNALKFNTADLSTLTRQEFTIPKVYNKYANGITFNNIKNIVAENSGVFQEFYGSEWMPLDKIPYDRIYNATKTLWETGHIPQAIYMTDQILMDMIGENQTFTGEDTLGHMSKSQAAWTQFYTMGIESLIEGATLIPSAVVGFSQAAFNPSELQTASHMSYFARALDNTLHNDWIPFLNNQNISDWSSELRENAVIYGNDFGDLLLSGAGSAGAQLGNLLMFYGGGLEAKVANKFLKNTAKLSNRLLKKEIVDMGKIASYNLKVNKAVDNINLFKANSAEAAMDALDGERQVYEDGENRKKELIQKYRPEIELETATDGLNAQYIIKPFEHHYTQEEWEEALNLQPNAEAWKAYLAAIQNGEAAIPPEEGVSVEAFLDKIARDAEGLHKLYQEIPDFNKNIEYNAKIKSSADWALQTMFLFLMDRGLGGLDKWTLDFATGRRSMKAKDVMQRLKGTWGNVTADKAWGKAIWTVLQNPIIEDISEIGQGTISAVTKQASEHNIDQFLENQMYGNGLLSWAHFNYQNFFDINPEEFSRDLEFERTVLQTTLTTALMPVIGWGGKTSLRPRKQNQSWVSRAIDAVQYYSPVNTTLGIQLYNTRQQNREVQAFADYMNRWGADPVNQANTRGLIGIQNYTEKMIADLINNDEVAYNNDVFSRTLSEAIMLANTQGTDFSQNRLQWLTNMSQIKSATAEQKAAAVQSMREEATGNSAVRNLSDEELLNLMESSSKKVLDTYNKVNDILSSDERFTDGTYNWQQQSALIFNRMAREDLNTRVADKENRIQAAIQSLGEIDLGESKTSKEKVEDNKVNNKKVLLSGRDILALSPMKRAAMLSPKNLKSYSPEQQKIIQETINALNQVDGNILNDIRNAGLEEYYLRQVEKDYKASLQTPGWESKRVKNKANNIKKAFSSEGNTQSFNTKLSQATSVQDIYNTILNEREANATRGDDSQINVEDVLNNIQNPDLKQKVEEARKIERVSNSIKSTIASTNLSDDVKDNLVQQVDKVASESSTVNNLTDISNYNIPLTPDGRDLSGDINNILQTAAQNASNTQTVDSEPVENFERPTDDIPEPTDLGERGVDTAMPVNESPLNKYTLDEAKQKLKELNNALVTANSAETNFQHDTLLVNASTLLDDLEKKLPEGYELQPSTENNFFIYKIVKTPVKKATTTPTIEDKKDDITDIDSRKEEPKQPIDRDGITKVAEVKFRERGNVYSYPVRDEDVQVGDGINNTIGSETGRVINIRDVQDDAEAEFLIYRTDENGNKVKRDRPQFIDRHSQQQEIKPEEQVKSEESEISIEEQPVSNRYSNRTEYQQSVVDNNITPAVTELDGTALSKGLFEPNQHTGQPNIMRQLQEEGAFDYMNKGALNEGDEIEFVVSQEQMPDGSYQVVIWEVTEPKDGEERTNPKWHGKQLLNVLDQTEVEGKRAELINRIRKAYEEAGRPESYLYTNEKFIVDNINYSTIPFRQTNPIEASSEETIESTNLQKGLIKLNGVWGVSFFNKAKGKMVHVPVMFRQAKKDKSGATRILFSDSRMKSKTINIRKTAVGGTGEMNTVSMVLPTPNGFVSVNSVYILTRNLPNSIDKYKESFSKGSVGKSLIEKIKSHLNDIKTVTAFSDYLGFRRGFSEYIYNDRTHGRIDLGYRGSTGNNVLVSAIPSNGKYILVDPIDARNILNDNNGQGFTLDEVCKEYLSQLVDSPEADVTMRLNMEAIENNPSIITDLIDDGLLWAPDSLNARFTAANTQFSSSLSNEAKAEPKKEIKQEPQQSKETPKPAPVVSSTNPSTTTTEVKKTKPKVDDTVELGSKVKRRKLKAGQSNQTRQEAPTTPTQESVTNSTVVSNPSSFETLSEKDKQHILSKVTKEEWDNLTKEEQDNILNC